MTGWTMTGSSQEESTGKLPKDCGEEQADQEEEPVAKFRAIAVGAGAAMISYGAADTFAQGDSSFAEDVVDLMHSAYTSKVAISGIASLEPHEKHTVALPSRLSKGRGPVVRMFCHSLGYFFADVLLILFGGLSGNLPSMWAGRLIHHVIQTCANTPCIFRTKPSEALALRSVLCIAYFAEFSNIFLRLSNLLRRRKSPPRVLQALNFALLGSFGVSRLANFFFAVRIFWQARSHIQPQIFKMLTTIQVSGYILNLLWFFKIAKIAMKPTARLSIK